MVVVIIGMLLAFIDGMLKRMYFRASLVRVISVIQVFKSSKYYHPEINIVSPFFFFIFFCFFCLVLLLLLSC